MYKRNYVTIKMSS